MFSSVFGLISTVPSPSPPSVVSSTPMLSSVQDAGGTSIAVSYFVNNAISNSGTTSVNIPIDANSSYSDYRFGSNSAWTLSSSSKYATWTQTFSGAPNYVYLSPHFYIGDTD